MFMSMGAPAPCCAARFFRRQFMKNHVSPAIASRHTTATPTPMPACAPVERPLEDEDESDTGVTTGGGAAEEVVRFGSEVCVGPAVAVVVAVLVVFSVMLK